MSGLPQRYRTLHDPARYPVRRSAGILELRERISQSGMTARYQPIADHA